MIKICLVCNKTFERADSKQNPGNKNSIRQIHCITCSTRCSSIYSKCVRTYLNNKNKNLK